MNARDPDLDSGPDPGPSRRGLLRWFGRATGRAGRAPSPVDPPAAGSANAPDPPFPEAMRDKRQRHMLEEIGRFLQAHRLPVTPCTLEAAHGIVTGASPQLGTLVAERLAQRKRITRHWLEDRTGELSRDQGAERVHALIRRLESALGEFASTASAARSAASDYNTALEAHAQRILPGPEATQAALELAILARDMIARTHTIERELSRSERKIRALRKRLADARRDAEIDHLTGLPNRRAFEAALKQEYARSRDTGAPLCVAFCDIDHFKGINDLHGHAAGDRVLRFVAQALAGLSSDACHVARHGGEEFVVLMRDTRLDEAFALIDAARADMAARKLVNRATDTPFGPVSFSAGLADIRAYRNTRAALRAADEALFRAKDAGRNRVAVANCADRQPRDSP